MILTRNGALCDSNGTLGFNEFEVCMREQIRFYAQRKLSESLVHDSFTAPELAQIGAVKVILHELLRSTETLADARKAETVLRDNGPPVSEVASAHTQIMAELKTLRGELRLALGNEQHFNGSKRSLEKLRSESKPSDEFLADELEPQLTTPFKDTGQDSAVPDREQEIVLQDESNYADNNRATNSKIGTVETYDGSNGNVGKAKMISNYAAISSREAETNFFVSSPINLQAEHGLGMHNKDRDSLMEDNLLCNSHKFPGPQENFQKVYALQDSQREELLKGAGSSFSVTVSRGTMSPREFVNLQCDRSNDSNLYVSDIREPLQSQSTYDSASRMIHTEKFISKTSPKIQFTLKSSLDIIRKSTHSSTDGDRAEDSNSIIHLFPGPLTDLAVDSNGNRGSRSNSSRSSAGSA